MRKAAEMLKLNGAQQNVTQVACFKAHIRFAVQAIVADLCLLWIGHRALRIKSIKNNEKIKEHHYVLYFDI